MEQERARQQRNLGHDGSESMVRVENLYLTGPRLRDGHETSCECDQNPLLLVVLGSRKTTSRGLRCYHAGKNAGGDFCCERPKETRRTKEKREAHTLLSQIVKGTIVCKVTDADVANSAADDSMEKQHIDFMRCGLPCACMFAQALQCKFLRVGVARACHMLVYSSSVFADQLQRAPACFRARMEKLGLLDPSLLDTIASLPADEVIAIFRDVSSGLTMDGYSMLDFFELLSTSHEPASRRRRVLAKLPMEEFSVLGASSTATTEKMEPPPVPEAIPPPRAGKHPGRWPTRMAKGLAEAQGPQAQQEIERKERERWLDVAVELAKQYDLPAWRLAAGSMDPAGLVRRSAGGRRAKTLRKRIRDFLRLRDWLVASGFFTFPNGDLGVKAVLSYLVARASEPCARSVPRNILMGLGFMEMFGGTSKADRVTLSPLLLRVVKDIEVDIAQGRGRHQKVAPPLLPSILVSMEKVVFDEGEKKNVRVFAWYWLVRVWGSMRFNDTLHIVPEDMHFKDEALVITVYDSKTTGPGKKVELLYVIISVCAYIAEDSWLKMGV